MSLLALSTRMPAEAIMPLSKMPPVMVLEEMSMPVAAAEEIVPALEMLPVKP